MMKRASNSPAPRKSWLRPMIVILIVLALLYAAGSYYVGVRAQHAIMQVAQTLASGTGGLRVQQHDSYNGVWRSGGTLQMTPVVSRPGAAGLNVDYEISHILWPKRLALVNASTVPTDPVQPMVQIRGTLDWRGDFESQLHMPAQSRMLDGQPIQISEMQGSLIATDQQLDMNLHWPQIGYQMSKKTTDLHDVRLRTRWRQGVCASQRYWLTVANAKVDRTDLQDVAFDAQVNCQATVAGRTPLRVDLQTEIKKVRHSLATLELLKSQVQVRDLNAQALQQLWSGWLIHTATGSTPATAWWREPVRALVLDGFEAQVLQFDAQTVFGQLDADANWRMKPVEGAARSQTTPLPFESYLSVEGQVRMTNLTPWSVLGLFSGLFESFDQGLRLTYDLSDSDLKLNGHSVPSSMVWRIINATGNKWLLNTPDDVNETEPITQPVML